MPLKMEKTKIWNKNATQLWISYNIKKKSSRILLHNSDYNIQGRWAWTNASTQKNYWDDVKNRKPQFREKPNAIKTQGSKYQEGKQPISKEASVGAATNKYKLAASKQFYQLED